MSQTTSEERLLSRSDLPHAETARGDSSQLTSASSANDFAPQIDSPTSSAQPAGPTSSLHRKMPSKRVASWQRTYASRLFITDLAIMILVSFGAQFSRFGGTLTETEASPTDMLGIQVSYTFLSIGLIASWMLVTQLMGTRDRRVVGTGSTEYKRVLSATLRTFGLLAIAAFLLRMPVARGYMIMALPWGIALLLLGRWLWRQWLNRQRRGGHYLHRAVIVGDPCATDHVIHQISRAGSSGYSIVGEVTTSNGPTEDRQDNPHKDIPVAVGYDSILETIDATSADTLILTSADVLTPERTRQLGWQLDERHIQMIVAPALTDIAGPRIHTRPVAGLPLIHIGYPQLEGMNYVLKRSFDILGSLALLLILSPLMLAAALAVKLTSPGPVFFRQERIGYKGRPFYMLKFRSMVVDAEEKLKTLRDQSDGNDVLFKMKNDPRVTRVGRFLRRYSLDELPQLLNALAGNMSLIGPRPPLEREVSRYDEWTHRRFLVRPGITGLWQVSGRSDLSWEDSVRLDLYYVENWSLMADIVILFRTLRAVLASKGAY